MGFVGNEYQKVKEHLGEIRQGAVVNFWTNGRYTMAGVVEYVIQQIGAVDVVACTWAISKPAVETLLRYRVREWSHSMQGGRGAAAHPFTYL